jgi:outer membrane protein TolC
LVVALGAGSLAAVEPASPSASSPPAPPAPAALELTLPVSLRLAHSQGRDKRWQDEELKLLAQAYANVRRDYGPQPSGSLSAGVAGGPGGAGVPVTRTGTANLGVSQTLPTNGTLAVTTATSRAVGNDGSQATTSNLTVAYTQPLLRDAGYLAWHERLTDAERQFVYAQRAHERFRQQLSLNIARAYWDLQRQQDAVKQARAALKRTRFLYEQTKALMDIGRSDANDVFRAELSLLGAEQQRLDAEAGLAAALNAFKQSLALPTATVVVIPAGLPEARRWRVDATQAIATALTRRLDWHTALDQLEDARRQVPLARRRQWADLGLSASAGWNGAAPAAWSDTFDAGPTYAAALTLTLPFDRRDEALAYERAVVGVVRAERSCDAMRQDLVRQVLDGLDSLRRADSSRLVQERNREQSRKRQEKARLDFEAGLIANRDLVEAQDAVLAADVAWAAAIIAWQGAALQLRFDTGTLAVDASGAWDDAPPPFTVPEESKP